MHWPGQSAPLLDRVSLTVAPGTVVSVVGDNGVGKTTLLRIAAGLLSPRSGSVSVDGVQIATDRRAYHRRIGLLTAASSGVYARMTVRQHLEMWVRIAYVDRSEREDLVRGALADFELTDIAARRADRVSMGQRQRLRLALTFMHRPRMVLLDEPFNSLDAGGRQLLLRAVGRVLADAGGVLWCAPGLPGATLAGTSSYELGRGRLAAR